MSQLIAAILQAILIAIGYILACVAAVSFATFAIANAGTGGLEIGWVQLGELVVAAVGQSLQGLADAFVPTVVAVVLAELFCLRSLTFWLVAGCVIGLLMALPMIRLIDADTLAPMAEDVVRVSVASAAIGGFVYWLIAGRSAGWWSNVDGDDEAARAD